MVRSPPLVECYLHSACIQGADVVLCSVSIVSGISSGVNVFFIVVIIIFTQRNNRCVRQCYKTVVFVLYVCCPSHLLFNSFPHLSISLLSFSLPANITPPLSSSPPLHFLHPFPPPPPPPPHLSSTIQTNIPIFKLKESSVRRRYRDFEWLKKELERDSKVRLYEGTYMYAPPPIESRKSSRSVKTVK